jgi:hypothetical protein
MGPTVKQEVTVVELILKGSGSRTAAHDELHGN